MNPDTTFAIFTAPKRDSRHWSKSKVTWGEIVSWMDSPGDQKESGNYLLGTLEKTTTMHDRARPDELCTNYHRRKQAVVSRSAITLDVDHPAEGFAEGVELAFPYAVIIHTTYSSTPSEPRYRLIIPTDRELAPDEYITAANAVMQMLGDGFDKSSQEPERYMFRPSSQRPQWFESLVVDGDPAPVDWLLESFEEDLSTKPIPGPGRNKRDPFEIEGTIGAFNKAYEDLDLLIETYELPYEKVDEDRYHLVGATSQAGMGPVRETAGLFYSHHANDPAFGKTCSAFDLVRLHRFSDLDDEVDPNTPVNKLPSHLAMLELAVLDHRAIAEMVGTDFAAEMDELAATDEGEGASVDWQLRLRRHPRTMAIHDEIRNWDLISRFDPVLTSLYYNQMSMSPETRGLPWRKDTEEQPEIREYDRLEFVDYLERTYGFRPTKARADALIDTKANQNPVHPVKDYLLGLEWDGKPRLELCLPGVKPTPFTRRVARMSLVAAVARVLTPGCKYDHTLVLYGDEGLGKSWWINRMAKGHSSSLGRIDNKDTLLVMQRSWVMVADEGHSLRKADSDAMKEFLTETKDVFRMPYAKETLPHPRRCVIWSTTNDETFLRRQQGNRRFLIVHCEQKVDFDKFTEEYVDQIWAEAVHLFENGEQQLWLDDDAAVEAAIERERFVEEDSLAGIIQEFLDQLVPMDWWSKSPDQRIAWMSDRDQGFEAEGDVQINRTCSLQIWVEAMGRRKGDHRRVDLLEITEAIKRVPGWRVESGRHRVPGYGPQLTFVRTNDSTLEDLL